MEKGFSTDSNKDFFSISNSFLFLQITTAARLRDDGFSSLLQGGSTYLTITPHYAPFAACSWFWLADYLLNIMPTFACLIVCLVISTSLHFYWQGKTKCGLDVHGHLQGHSKQSKWHNHWPQVNKIWNV